MDIYEALKAGATPEEMKRDFEKQLKEAIEKKKAEEAAAAKAKVDEIRVVQLREKLINALDDYCQKAYGADPMDKATRELIENMYKTFEKDTLKTTAKKKSLTDEDILHRWFQSLI
jgi:hypothetical protein